MQNNINQYNFTGIEENRPGQQLETFSPIYYGCNTDLMLNTYMLWRKIQSCKPQVKTITKRVAGPILS